MKCSHNSCHGWSVRIYQLLVHNSPSLLSRAMKVTLPRRLLPTDKRSRPRSSAYDLEHRPTRHLDASAVIMHERLPCISYEFLEISNGPRCNKRSSASLVVVRRAVEVSSK